MSEERVQRKFERHHAVWLGLLVAGLLLRLWFFAHPMSPDGDTDPYAELGRNLFQHGTYGIASDGVVNPSLFRLPGYPLFLALVLCIFGWANYNAVLLLQIVFDLVSCWLIASFVCENVSRRAGTIALGIAALCPFTAAYASIALTECLSVFAVSLALWATGRLLRAQAAGKSDTGAIVGAVIGMAMAVLLRPDGALVSMAVAAALLWYGWRQRRPVAALKTALVCCVLAALPLVPWTIRNWRTFHVFQPLAPRRVNDPGEAVNYGFYRWMNTWAVDYVSTGNVFWQVGSAAINVNDLPSRAFDSPAQRAETAALLTDYNVNKLVTPALDARFDAIASERVREHSLLCHVWVPTLRVADMFLRPRNETLGLDADWWRFDEHEVESAEAVGLGLLNLAIVGLAVIAVVRRQVPWPALAVVYVGLRCVVLSGMENSEPRYTLEAMPILIACAACVWSETRKRQAAAESLPTVD